MRVDRRLENSFIYHKNAAKGNRIKEMFYNFDFQSFKKSLIWVLLFYF